MNMDFWRTSKKEQVEMRKSLKDTCKSVMIFTAILTFIIYVVTHAIVFYVFLGLTVALAIFYFAWVAFGPIKKEGE